MSSRSGSTSSQLTRGGTYDITRQWRVVRFGTEALDSWSSTSPFGQRARVAVVTSPSCAASGIDRWACQALVGREAIATFDACRPHSPAADVAGVAQLIADSGAELVLAVGGGSVMDTTKMARIVAAGTSAAGVLERLRSRAAAPADRVPLIALPTTLSGAELTAVMGITDEVSREKVVVDITNGAPDEVVFDPRMTVGTPDAVWAATGVKAMSDAVEELVSNHSSPAVDPMALRALQLFRENLRAGPEDLEGRLSCQLATWLTLFGIISSGTGAGVAAALRHQLGAVTGLAHGRVAASLLAPVLRFNWSFIDEWRRQQIAEAFGVAANPPTIDAVVEEITAFLSSLGIGAALGATLDDATVAEITEHARREFATATNPRPVERADELLPVVEEALGVGPRPA